MWAPPSSLSGHMFWEAGIRSTSLSVAHPKLVVLTGLSQALAQGIPQILCELSHNATA